MADAQYHLAKPNEPSDPYKSGWLIPVLIGALIGLILYAFVQSVKIKANSRTIEENSKLIEQRYVDRNREMGEVKTGLKLSNDEISKNDADIATLRERVAKLEEHIARLEQGQHGPRSPD